MKIGIFGTGAYGIALTSVLTKNDCDITMWTKFEEEKNNLEQTRQNTKYFEGYKIDERIKITNNIEECVKNKDLLIIAIPVEFIEELLINMKKYIKDNHILIASKGIEKENGLFISEIVEKYLDTKNIGIISGPSFAIDLITENPIGLSLASKSNETMNIVKNAFKNGCIKIKETEDIYGTELCGALKNIFAIATGILDGLETTDSTKATFMTEVFNSMKDILNKFNCNKETMASYAGIGDLLLTCTSVKSRNYCFGKLIGQKRNRDKEDYLNNNTVEGYNTLKSVMQLLKRKNFDIEIINLIYKVVIEDYNPEILLSFIKY